MMGKNAGKTGKELGPGDTGISTLISGAEVTEVVEKLLGGSASAGEEICPEFLQTLDVVGL